MEWIIQTNKKIEIINKNKPKICFTLTISFKKTYAKIKLKIIFNDKFKGQALIKSVFMMAIKKNIGDTANKNIPSKNFLLLNKIIKFLYFINSLKFKLIVLSAFLIKTNDKISKNADKVINKIALKLIILFKINFFSFTYLKITFQNNQYQ